jgi:hypothetical protein
MRRALCIAVGLLVGVATPVARGAGVHVSGDTNAVRVVADQEARVSISRAPDGQVRVLYDAPGLAVHALGACPAAGGVATCPASVTTASVWLWGRLWGDLTVEPGAALTVSVFAGGGDNKLDLQGATTAQVTCGAGSDAVQVGDPSRIGGDCEQVNGAPWLPAQVLGTAAPGELDAAPGGLAWIDTRGLLHVRTAVATLGHTVRPDTRTTFGRLDVGLDRRGRAVASVAECVQRFCDRWFSVDVKTGRRSALRVKTPSGCSPTAVARWRSRTAVGLDCSRQLVINEGRKTTRVRFPATVAPTSVDLRGNLVVAGFGTQLWIARDKPRRCQRLFDQALPGANLGRAALLSGDRIISSHSDAKTGLNPAYWDTIAAIDRTCAGTARYFLPGSLDEAATLIGATLVETTQHAAVARPFVTAPDPLWIGGTPWDWSTDPGLAASVTPGSWF